MTLYTPDCLALNYKARLDTLESILNNREAIALHNKANRPALAKSAMNRLAEDEFRLYELNKDYDEMLTARVNAEPTPRKSLIKKLLRK